ncbi:MAG: organic solvent tolerance protein OstA [Acholeplasmataceae bacterium]|nr:organic solvent tolerance protein OstA [Acholeplasmataceae bacterium]
MKKQILLTGILVIGIAANAFAAEYAGTGKIGDREGPDFSAETTLVPERESAQAKSAKKTKGGQEQPQPITLYGDKVVYHQDTGDFFAEGNIRVVQGSQVLTTEKIEGNAESGDVLLKSGGRLSDGVSVLAGEWLHYNFNNETGEIKKISGSSGKDFFKAEHATVQEGSVHLDKGGQVTRCPAVEHDPCVLLTAGRIDIYPKDRIVAHDVKIFVKGRHIFTRDVFVSRLDRKTSQTFAPKIGYSDDSGLKFRLRYEHNFTEQLSLVGDFDYYEKIGYRPMYGLQYEQSPFYARLQQGWNEDGDDNWIKKEADLTLGFKNLRFNDGLPLSYSVYYNRGRWQEDDIRSWHTEYGIFLNHDRIFFDKPKSLFLDLGVGAKRKEESYNDSTTDTMTYRATLGKKFDRNWNAWTSYFWEKSDEDLFAYNRPDMEEELQNGLTYKFDDRNSLTFVNRYDLGSGSLYEQDWRYTHDFCCWRIEVEYRDKKREGDKSWHVRYDLFRW